MCSQYLRDHFRLSPRPISSVPPLTPSPRASSTSCHAAAARARPPVAYTSQDTACAVAAGDAACLTACKPHHLRLHDDDHNNSRHGGSTGGGGCAAAAGPGALHPVRGREGPEALRRAGACSAPPLGMSAGVRTQGPQSAAHESKMQQARVHLGRRVRARIDSGAAAPPARCGYIRGRGRLCRGGGGGERRRRWPGVVASAATVPGPLPAGEVVGSSGHLDVCVRRYDVVGAPSAGTASEQSVAPLHCWGWARAARHPPPPLPLPPCSASSRPSHRRCGFTRGGHPKAGPGHYQCQPHRGGGRGDGTGTGGRGGNGGWDGSGH
jgi:hypothetical protein